MIKFTENVKSGMPLFKEALMQTLVLLLMNLIEKYRSIKMK